MNRTRNSLISLFSSILMAGVVSHASAESAKSGYVEPKINHAAYGTLKVVVPITTDDKAVHGMKLRNIENGLDSAMKWDGQMQDTVVLYAKGVSLLQNPDAETRQKIDLLKTRGVRFAVCDNTLREQGIDFHQLYQVNERDIVPSGFAEVAYLQAKKNYVVDPVN